MSCVTITPSANTVMVVQKYIKESNLSSFWESIFEKKLIFFSRILYTAENGGVIYFFNQAL